MIRSTPTLLAAALRASALLASALLAGATLAGCTPAPPSSDRGTATPPSTRTAAADDRTPPAAPATSADGTSSSATPPPSAADHVDHADARTDDPTEPGAEAGSASGVLPLATGVYVMQDAGCAAPPNAAVRFYDGQGISGSATHACRTQVRSQRGATYTVEQSCIDTPAGDGPRSSEAQTITVHDAHAFTLATDNGSARYRHCPPEQLPEYLRTRMAQGN